ncbi:MAG TPA: TlpA disulfide reductase family protein [Pelomicrobium sp.]|nr:TlpA disulfide reductase family protein [Pelomicrobium sp.]
MQWPSRNSRTEAGLRRAACAAVAALLLGACETASVPPQIDQLGLRHLDGRPASSGVWQGRWVVMNFWAVWCEPCRRELPSLQCLSERVDSARVTVVGVTIDEDLRLAQEYIADRGIGFPMYAWGPQAAARPQAIPETLVFAPDGSLHRRVVGVEDWADPALARRLGIPLANAGATSWACSTG